MATCNHCGGMVVDQPGSLQYSGPICRCPHPCVCQHPVSNLSSPFSLFRNDPSFFTRGVGNLGIVGIPESPESPESGRA